MPEVEEFLNSFVPTALAAECGVEHLHVEGRHFDAAVLLADLSGFTALAERLAERPDGAELVTGVLNDVFGLTLDVLGAHGGAPTKFAGDSTIAIWKSSEDQSIAEPLARACACALALQDAMAARPTKAGESLRLRIGVAAGRVWTGRVGGVEGRWEHLFDGSPIAAAGRAAARVSPGQVGLAPAAVDHLDGRARVATLPEEGFRLLAVGPIAMPQRTPAAPELPSALLTAFIPRMVAERAAAGHREWLAEFRRVSVVFLNIGAVNTDAADVLPQMQSVMRAVQEAVYRYDGSVNQVVADDKGTSFLLAWNLPSLAREDAAVRAVRAALTARESVLALGVSCAVGLATGRAFCGLRGASTRREYAIVGAVVNRAARLMQAATEGLRVDEWTMGASSRRLQFEPAGMLTLKGVAAPVATFTPIGEIDAQHNSRGLIGRADDLASFDDRLTHLQESHKSGVLVFEGEPGIGKSALMAACAEHAQQAGLRTLSGAADAVETATPYFAWRRIFQSILSAPRTPQERAEAVLARVARIDGAQAKLPLVSGLLSLAVEETDTTRQMTPDARAEQARELLIALIESAAAAEPLVIFLDDAHWFDSASWALVAALARRPSGVLLVVGTRPLAGALSIDASTLISVAGDGRRILSPLGETDVVAVVCERLGVAGLPQALIPFIQRKAAGNPFFSEQLALALRDRGHLIIDGDGCRLAPGIDLDRIDIPSTLEGVITGRIDTLAPGPQLTLKVASVIGRAFRARTLRDVHPLGLDQAALAIHLEELARRDLLVPQGGGADPEYLFKHVVLQDVTYGLMTFTQRRGLHEAVARWLESQHEGDLEPYLATLAHHWRQNGQIEKAVIYLERAAARAFESSANEDIVRLAGDAIALSAEHSLSIDRIRLARWRYWRGLALYRLGQIYPSGDDIRSGLALLDQSTPATMIGAATELIREALRQAFRALLRPGPAASPAERPALVLAANIYHRYLDVIYALKGPLWSLSGTLRSLNLSEGLGRSPELGTSYAIAGFWAGQLGFAGLARTYYDRGLPMVEEADQPGVLGHACMSRGLYGLSAGKWDDAKTYLLRGIDAYQRAGDKSRMEQLMLMMSNREMQRARHAEARAWLDRARASLWPYGSYMSRAWVLFGDLIIACRQRQADPTTVRALETEMKAEAPNAGDHILALSLIAHQRVLIDGPIGGWKAATAALAAAEETPPTGFHVGMGLLSLTEAYLDIAEAAGNSADQDRARRESARACRALSRLARLAPSTRAAAGLATGRQLSRHGSSRDALRQLRAAVRHAEQMDQRYEAAHAHFALGTVESLPSDEAAHHRSSAARLFAVLDVPPPYGNVLGSPA